MNSELYYECHVTIEPVFDKELAKVQEIARTHKFRVADLLMKKRKKDTVKRSEYDTFMTSRSKSYEDLESRMRDLISDIRDQEIVVWRYKIEDTVVDSKIKDELELL